MRIIFRPLLVSGMYGEVHAVDEKHAEELRHEIEALAALGVRPVILIASNQPDDQKIIGLWHEILHMILVARGQPHDEDWIEATARKMAAATPDLLDKIGDTNG